MARVKRGGLGRGLDALFADAAPIYEPDQKEKGTEEEAVNSGIENAEKDSAQTPVEAETSPAITGLESAASTDDSKKTTNKKARTSRNIKGSSVSHSSELKQNDAAQDDADSKASEDDLDRVIYIDINDIKPNADQPRKRFDEDKLKELAQSIEDNGVIQPLLVRRSGKNYELVAGERRWRAARMAGLRKIPCLVRELDEQQNMIVAIVENMQREDLDPIEEAAGINEMMKRFGFTQDQVSKALGKSRPYIANATRLLGLPSEVQDMISAGELSAAHGRTIAGVQGDKKQIQYASKTVREGLSVRSLERLINKEKEQTGSQRKRKRRAGKDPAMQAVEEELRSLFGTKVNISGDGTTGKLEIEYYSLDELNRLIDMIRTIEA